jgi:CheY-like chemotaxis protein
MAYRASILVVDDDEAIREVVADVLRGEGYRVTLGENGEEALAELRRDGANYDLVLLDLMMPVMSGWEVLEQVGEDPSLSRVPVIVMSAMGGPGERAQLVKPIDLDRLLDEVKQATDGLVLAKQNR